MLERERYFIETELVAAEKSYATFKGQCQAYKAPPPPQDPTVGLSMNLLDPGGWGGGLFLSEVPLYCSKVTRTLWDPHLRRPRLCASTGAASDRREND